MEEEGVVRISISIPPDLLRKFDDATERVGYSDRSKAVRDAMQNLITESKWLCEKMGKGVGVIVLSYDHEAKDIEGALMDTQHRFEKIITSSMHVHLNKNNYLEIIAVNGPASDVQNMAQELKTKKGVNQLKLAIVTP
ncbi:MAG: CopG family transcriptional regulator, nickel-responsive regulator [Thermoproteota archaeon]|nr:CopG family transcriptional regulator, nickel-responsive regulator [Thermoproteota archaeon]